MTVQAGDQYFTETLSQHFGHKVEIARYTEMYTDKVTDYRLHCTEPECEDPVGIAVEVVIGSDDVCTHGTITVDLTGHKFCLDCREEMP